MHNIEYSPRERFWLCCLALLGFFGVNAAFLLGMAYQPEALVQAMTNPIAAAFMVEALILMGVFAYLLRKWGVGKLHWAWFVLLSLLGSMAFALPIVILWSRRAQGSKP